MSSQNDPRPNRVPTRHFSRRAFLGATLAGSAAAVAAPIAGRQRLAAAQTGPATPPPGGDTDDLFAEFDAFVARRMAELKVPGVAVGLIAGDRDHTAAFGVTNVDHPLPIDTDTLFQIGSTTKTFTATTIMRLIEQEKLDLETPVRAYLPDFRVADLDVSAEVRLRHLVTHTAGWYDDALSQETGDGDDALARYVDGMADLPQVTPLGEFFSYNNGAVCLAGRVIEAVTGQTYEAAVTELVLKPLGMERATFFPEQMMTEAFAVGHGAPPDDPAGAPVVRAPWALPRFVNPAGGLVASLRDELRYAHFHLGDGTVSGTRVLSPEGLRRMRTPLGPGGTVPQLVVDNVGVNWQLQRRGGVTIVSHPGGTNGQQSNLCLVPARGFAVTVLTNADAGAILDIEATDWALERFLGLPRPTTTPVPLPPARLAEYAGEYDLPENGGTIRIREEDGTLRLAELLPGQTVPAVDSPLRFVGDDLATFDFVGLSVYTDFVRDGAGKVVWIRFVGRMVPRAT
ncbi:MAG TPA: serine hydrolase domain-containing protein [Thermomicrobiales bacterium]